MPTGRSSQLAACIWLSAITIPAVWLSAVWDLLLPDVVVGVAEYYPLVGRPVCGQPGPALAATFGYAPLAAHASAAGGGRCVTAIDACVRPRYRSDLPGCLTLTSRVGSSGPI